MGTRIDKFLLSQSIPAEIERVLLQPESSAQIARTFTSNAIPAIERQTEDIVSKTLLPTYTQHHQDPVQGVVSMRREMIT